jgi:hypothetical protein
VTISISKTELRDFYNYRCLNHIVPIKHNPNHVVVRLGQAFHQYFKLDKITNEENKIFCDRLYEMDGEEAMKAIATITDHTQ